MTGSADGLACPACDAPLLGNFDASASLNGDTLRVGFDCPSYGTPLALVRSSDAEGDEPAVEEREE